MIDETCEPLVDEPFHHKIQHFICRDVMTAEDRIDQEFKLKSFKETIDSLERWVRNAEEIVIK